MKASELRIGNFTFWAGKHRQIEEILKDSVYYPNVYVGAPVEDIEPIPLTPKILEKAGFYRLNYGWIVDNGAKNEHGDTIHGDDTFGIFDHSFGKCDDLRYGKVKITHLHQLQNLYFALTGEELEIKFEIENPKSEIKQ